MTADRRALVQGLWPDKILYGATLLLVTSLLGILHGAALTFTGVTFSENIPARLRTYPAELTLLFSLLAAALAVWSLNRHDIRAGLLGGLAGVLSLGLLGLGSLLSVLAIVAMALGFQEGEDIEPATGDLHAGMWPDKALAASVLLTISGILTLAWGVALARGAVEFTGYLGSDAASGLLAIVAGVLSLGAAGSLFLQRYPSVAVAACVAGVLALGLWVVGPLLSLAALVLVWQAWREGEFDVASGASAA